MRRTIFLSTVSVLLLVAMAVALVACGGGTTTSSSTPATTASETTTAAGATTTASGGTATTTAGETTTTATGSTTATSAGGTTTSSEATTTTEAARTTDTSDHSAEFRAQYPSTESFNNSTWATLNSNPSSHLGAAADVTGVPSKVTVDPDSLYLTWQLTISSTTGTSMTALCRTNVNVDRTLLSAGGTVEVKGLVVGAQAATAGGGPIIYVQTVTKAA
jgi:hypothetical protein